MVDDLGEGYGGAITVEQAQHSGVGQTEGDGFLPKAAERRVEKFHRANFRVLSQLGQAADIHSGVA
ncbi:hypothetical protein GCM10027456_06290 [Kineosporia babensis]